MIFIDLEHKKPTDTNIPGWAPWTQVQWDTWIDKSNRLVGELAALEATGQHEQRNALIDANGDIDKARDILVKNTGKKTP